MGCHCLLHIIGDWNAKVESQEIPGVTGKFGLGVQNEAGQRLIDVFMEFSYFFYDPVDVGNLISSSSAFSK